MRIFFDNMGSLKNFDRDMVAATSSGHKLFIYAEFDTVVNTDLMVTVTIKRSDGFIVGPLPASEYVDDSGVLCRVVELNKQVLAVPGPLELTVRYDYYGSNDFGEKVRVATRALAKTVAHVYEAVGEYTININYSEYANPTFDSKLETLVPSLVSGGMSPEKYVDELWGDSLGGEERLKEIEYITNSRTPMQSQGMEPMDLFRFDDME